MFLKLDENGKTRSEKTARIILHPTKPCSHDKKRFKMFKTSKDLMELAVKYAENDGETDDEEDEPIDISDQEVDF